MAETPWNNDRNKAGFTLRELTETEIRTVYEERMKQDFPASELKPLSMLLGRWKEKRYCCYGIFDNAKTLAGYAYFTLLDEKDTECVLLDYLAIDANRRGQGIGSAFFTLLSSAFPNTERVLIEAEDPEAAFEPEEKAHRLRRIHFYNKAGALDSGVRAVAFEVQFVLLCFDLQELPIPGETARDYEKLYQSMLGPAGCDKHVFVKSLKYPIA